MPIPLIPLAITAATWLGRIGLAAFAINEIKKLTEGQKATIDESTKQAEAAGVSDDEVSKLVAATTYEQVEKDGKNPDDFWKGLSPAEQAKLKWSPEVLKESMQRTTFLGLSQTLLWVSAGVAAGVAGFRGIPILLSTLGKLATARAAGASALSLMTIIEEGKIAGIAKVWIPGLIAGIASAGGWLTGGLTNNLNDALLWGRIFLDQAHEDVKKAALQRGTGTGTGVAATPEPISRTRITISKTAEPKVAVGTLFQSIVKSTDAFKRKVDDEITSAEDLKADVHLNLNHWLATLPGRLHYEVRVVLNPLDENGNKQLGTWCVLMLGHRNSQGVFQHLQAVLLGPIDPTVYRPTTREIETIQIDIPKLLTSEEIINLDLPTTGLRTVDRDGNVTPITFGSTPRTQSPTPRDEAFGPKPFNEISKEAQAIREGSGLTPAPVPATAPTPATPATAPTPTIPPATPTPQTESQQVQQGQLTPYIRFESNENIYARLSGRKVAYEEAVNAGYFGNNLVQDRPASELNDFLNKFRAIENPRPTPTPVQISFPPVPPQQIGTGLPAAPAPAKKPYVQYLGSPNVFDRQNGQWINEQTAKDRNIFALGLIEMITNPRPEVKVASDFAIWNNRNLTQFPI